MKFMEISEMWILNSYFLGGWPFKTISSKLPLYGDPVISRGVVFF